jgi:hypothetical protein
MAITPQSGKKCCDFILSEPRTGCSASVRKVRGLMGLARSIGRPSQSPGAPMDHAILRAGAAGLAPGATARHIPCRLTYTHFLAGRFSHLREDVSDAR